MVRWPGSWVIWDLGRSSSSILDNHGDPPSPPDDLEGILRGDAAQREHDGQMLDGIRLPTRHAASVLDLLDK